MKELLGLGVLAWPLVLLVAILLGFVIAILFGVAYAKRHGKRAWLWAMLAFLVVFLPIFWDWIPTVVAHKYYCATEAGFWIYKTPEQWNKENPGVMEELTTRKVWQHDFSDDGDVVHINQRFDLIYKKEGEFFLHRWKWQQKLVDIRTNEVLVQYVDFSTGNGFITSQDVPLKFWIQSGYCSGGRDRAIESAKWINQFKGTEK